MITQITKISILSTPDVLAVLYALREVIPPELAAGNAVKLEGLGTFRISVATLT